MIWSVDEALLALGIELNHHEWRDYVLESIERGHTWGGMESEESIHLDNWFAIVKEQKGPKGRGHYQGNGRTIREAVIALADELVSRRTNPHLWHINDWMQESRFVRGCADCERDAHELFDDEVDWDDE